MIDRISRTIDKAIYFMFIAFMSWGIGDATSSVFDTTKEVALFVGGCCFIFWASLPLAIEMGIRKSKE